MEKGDCAEREVVEIVIGTSGNEGWSVAKKGLGILEKSWSAKDSAVKVKISTAKRAPAAVAGLRTGHRILYIRYSNLCKLLLTTNIDNIVFYL